MTKSRSQDSSRRPAGEQDSIYFLSFHLDKRGGRLIRGGDTIALRPKTWAVLVYLAERPGVMISKDEILDAVWPGVTVTPDTLTKSIGELRVALGEDSNKPRCIETVHGRGFRFIADAAVEQPIETVPLRQNASDGPRLFVGRQQELAQLETALAQACAARRQIVFVTGSAGMGKSTLVDAFLDSAELRTNQSAVRVGRGICIDQHGAREPYLPVLDALERLARSPEAERLIRLLRDVAPTWLAQMPWLVPENPPRWDSGQKPLAPERMLREFAVFVEALTSETPIVLVLEDLHWCDPSTVDLLSFVAQRRDPAHLLVIGTYRPAEVAVQNHPLSEAVRRLQVHRECTHVPLYDLNPAEVQEYLEQRFPAAEFSSGLAPVVYRYTDGTPLFVSAVIDHLLSDGLIRRAGSGWTLGTAPEALSLPVPEDAQRLIQLLLERLSAADRDLLEAASVAGNEFGIEAVGAALGWGPEEVETRCESLARSQVFLRPASRRERGDGRVDRRYGFVHELYRRAAYTHISEGRRQRLHLHIGEALEAAEGEAATEIAAELAVHFQYGRDYKRALRYLRAAAEGAQRRLASREAASYFQSALEIAERLPDGDEQRRQQLDVLVALTPLLSWLHGYGSEELRVNCERAAELCARAGTQEQLFEILYGLCQIYVSRTDKALAPATLVRLADCVQSLPSVPYRLIADATLLRCNSIEGNYAETSRMAEALPALESVGCDSPELTQMSVEALLDARAHHALALWFLGHTERARATMQSMVAAARATAHVFLHTLAFAHGALLAVLCREPDEAGQLAAAATRLADEHGFRFYAAIAAAMHGWAAVQQGAQREGLDELERARVAHRATRTRVLSTHILAFLAEAHLAAGSIDAALASVNEGLGVADSTLDRMYWPELWRLKGELLLAKAAAASRSRRAGRQRDAVGEEAETCLTRALEMARQSEARSLELRAATSLARAWYVRGRTTEARDLLAATCRWFPADLASAALTEARALLASWQ